MWAKPPRQPQWVLSGRFYVLGSRVQFSENVYALAAVGLGMAVVGSPRGRAATIVQGCIIQRLHEYVEAGSKPQTAEALCKHPCWELAPFD